MGSNEVGNKVADVIEETGRPYVIFIFNEKDIVTGDLVMSTDIHSGQLIALGVWLQERGLHIIRKAQLSEERLIVAGAQNLPLPRGRG